MAKTSPTPDALGRLAAARPLRDLARRLAESNLVSASGLWGSSVAAVVAAVRAELNRPVLLICGHLDEGDDLADDIELFTGKRPHVLPALELGGTLGRGSEELASTRLQLIAGLAAASKGDAKDFPSIVAPVPALMQSVPAREELAHLVRTSSPATRSSRRN